MGYIEQEIWFQKGNQKVFTLCTRPKKNGTFPTILLAHGFGGSYQDNLNCAEFYAENGYVVFSIDFCGGSNTTRSDGSTKDMSVVSEVKDLHCVFEQIQTLDFVQKNKIFLWGESQGGFVSALLASQLKEKIAGLILLYPAFNLQDAGKQQFKDYDKIQDSIVWDVSLGKKYYQDIWNLDIYSEISKYQGKVFLFHGTEDEIVPLDYSYKAKEVYKDCTFTIVQNGQHGFFKEIGRWVDSKIMELLKENE